MNYLKNRLGLSISSALALALPSVAWAQDAATAPASDLPADIIVTATKRSETINRVPVSVSALSQSALDTQSIRDITDLARTVPGLNFTPSNAGGAGAGSGVIIAIRGIYATAGAAATGVYLDDVPLQKRFAPGATASGSPLPQLFDLERVEVLRGPQGTLFGGSSEGGAVRFITPPPSLTRFSGQVRAETYATKTGDPSGELGAAVGGPIVRDILGFRASLLVGHVGGYVDHINPRTQQPIGENTNSETHVAARAALLFEPVSGLRITPSFYLSRRDKHDSDDFWSNYAGYTSPVQSFGANGRAASATNPAVFTRPAVTYPARTAFGPGKSGDLRTSPVDSDLTVSSLAVNYDAGAFSVTSITALTVDETRANLSQPATLEGVLAPQFGGYNILGPDDPAFMEWPAPYHTAL